MSNLECEIQFIFCIFKLSDENGNCVAKVFHKRQASSRIINNRERFMVAVLSLLRNSSFEHRVRVGKLGKVDNTLEKETEKFARFIRLAEFPYFLRYSLATEIFYKRKIIEIL